MSKKIIVGIPNCPKCQNLHAQCPDVEFVEVQPNELLAFARAVGIQSMPFLVTTDPTVGDIK